MNPLDLPGPAFLALYVVCGGAACLVVHWLNRASEPDVPTGTVPTDPQVIAYLRDGVTEVIRVTGLALLERELLTVGPKDTLAVTGRAAGSSPSPIDAAVCGVVSASSGQAHELFRNEQLATFITEHVRPALEGTGLIPDTSIREARQHRALIAFVALATLAALKIAVALGRGHSNVGLLVAAAAIFAVILWRLTERARTRAGDRALDYLRHTFEPLRARTKGKAHPPLADLAILAAVFGLSAVSDVPFAQASALHWRPGGDGSGCGGGGCGGCGGCG